MNDLTLNRKGESEASSERSERSERIFIQRNYWYFRTREGMDIGPYDSQTDAISGISSFIEFLSTAERKVVERLSDYATKVA